VEIASWRPPFLQPCGLFAAILGSIAVNRGRARGVTSHGQAVAGIVCGILALVVAVVFAIRIGTFVANNTSVFTTFDNCVAKAGDRSAVSSCIAASRTTSGRSVILRLRSEPDLRPGSPQSLTAG
jgi:hypothetical protein